MECNSKYNFIKNGMSLKIEGHSKNVHQNETSLKMDYHSKLDATQNGISLKMECH